MTPDGAVGRAQPEPEALRALGREEGLERAPPHRLGHADPAIRDGAAHAGPIQPGPDEDLAAAGHGVDGVQDEVHEDLAERGRLAQG